MFRSETVWCVIHNLTYSSVFDVFHAGGAGAAHPDFTIQFKATNEQRSPVGNGSHRRKAIKFGVKVASVSLPLLPQCIQSD